MKNFLQLQQFRPGDSRIDTAPVQNALEAYGNKTMQFGQIQRQQEEQTYQRGRDTKQDARQDETFKQQNLERLGKSAFAYSQLPENQRDPATWGKIVKGMQAYDPSIGTEPDDMDWRTGPAKFGAVYGGQVQDPMDAKMKQAELAYKHAATDQLRQKAEPNPILEMLKSRAVRPSGGAAPGGQPPLLQPQSNTTQPGMPGVVLANESDPQAAAAPAQQEPMVSTPFGDFTRQDAEAMAYGLMADPKTAQVGRALFDQISKENPDGWQKPAMNTIEEKMLTSGEAGARLSSIRQRFKPEFLNIEKRIGFAWNTLAEKISANALKPEQKAELEQYYSFKSDTIDNLNQYIKEITGAAMTIPEAQRIMQAVPNAGEGILDGDSPTQFKAKLDATMQRLLMVQARQTFAKKTGKPWSQIPLEQMNGIIQNKTDELQGRFQQQGLKGNELRNAVKQGLKQEFGI
jgi:Fe-S cluster biosynthesis and repair protein YggX